MKKLSYFSYFFAAQLLALACNDFHDNIQPEDNLPIDGVYKTTADLESALNGAYNSLQSGNLAGAGLFLIPELMSGNGNFIEGGFPDELDLANHTLRSSNYEATIFWQEAYKAINLANAVLANLDVVTDAAQRNRIEGEALFIRGYLYFELVRYFGQPWGDNSPENGVPIVTGAIFQKGDLTFPARATVQQVYAQATADLTQAKDLLPLYPYDRANHYAAVALLARMAFQKADYAAAEPLARYLVEQVGFSLKATPGEFFTDEEASNEAIWNVRFTPADGNSLTFWFHESVGFIPISEELKAAFDSIVPPAQKMAIAAEGLSVVDLRAAPPLVSADGNFINKYEDVDGSADDAPMIRFAEIVLLFAETLARQGDLPGSVFYLNQVRARSLRVVDATGNVVPDKQHLVLFDPSAFQVNPDALIEAIIIERRVELAFEGNYFQDAIRLHRNIGGLAYNDCRLRLPIPQREMDVNKNLKQNEPCY